MSIDKFNKELLFRYFQEVTTPEENKAILQWIRKSEENKKLFFNYKSLWNSLSPVDSFLPDNTRWKEIEKRASVVNFSSNKRNILFTVLKYAAVFFIGIMSIGLFQWQNETPTESMAAVEMNEISVPKGSKTRLVLPDGTQVWLNAGSLLRYGQNFGEETREVYLEGEGYFEVVKNLEKQFVVNTNEISVSALGTIFNVKAYPGDETVETTLVEGKVKVENKNKEETAYEPIYLLPNQSITLHKKVGRQTTEKEIEIAPAATIEKIKPTKVEKIVLKEEVDAVEITSWKDGRWIIESKELEELAVQFERMYDVTIHFENDKLKDTRFSGTLKDESLEQVLTAMKLTAPLDYEVEGKNVWFKYLEKR